jgi:hypothetical protein
MRTHIMIAIMSLVISACASKRDPSSVRAENYPSDQVQQAQMIDAAMSSRGGGPI